MEKQSNSPGKGSIEDDATKSSGSGLASHPTPSSRQNPNIETSPSIMDRNTQIPNPVRGGPPPLSGGGSSSNINSNTNTNNNISNNYRTESPFSRLTQPRGGSGPGTSRSSSSTAATGGGANTLARPPSGGIRHSSSDEPLIFLMSGTDSQTGSSPTTTPRKAAAVANSGKNVVMEGRMGRSKGRGEEGGTGVGAGIRVDSPPRSVVPQQRLRGAHSPNSRLAGAAGGDPHGTSLSDTAMVSVPGGYGSRIETPARGTNPNNNNNNNINSSQRQKQQQQLKSTPSQSSPQRHPTARDEGASGKKLHDEPTSPFYVRESFFRGPLMTEEESLTVNMISDNRYRPPDLEGRMDPSSPKDLFPGGGGNGNDRFPSGSRNAMTHSPTKQRRIIGGGGVNRDGNPPVVERNALYDDDFQSSAAAGVHPSESSSKSDGHRKYIGGNFQHRAAAPQPTTDRDESLATMHSNSNGNWSSGPQSWIERRKKGKAYLKEHYNEENNSDDERTDLRAPYYNADDVQSGERGRRRRQQQQRYADGNGSNRRGGGGNEDESGAGRGCLDSICAIPRYAGLCALDACSGCIFACTSLHRGLNVFILGMLRGTSPLWVIPRIVCAIILLPCCIGAMISVFAYTMRARFANRTDWIVISFIGIVHQIAFLVPLTHVLSPWSAWELHLLGLFRTDFVGPIVLYLIMSLYWTCIALRMYVSVQKWWKSVWPIMGPGKRDGQQQHHHHHHRSNNNVSNSNSNTSRHTRHHRNHSSPRRRSGGTESWSQFANAYAQGYHGDHDEEERTNEGSENWESSGADTNASRSRGNRSQVNSGSNLRDNVPQKNSKSQRKRRKDEKRRHYHRKHHNNHRNSHKHHSRQRRRDRNVESSSSFSHSDYSSSRSSTPHSSSRSSSAPSSSDWCEDKIVPEQILQSSSFPPALQQHLNTRLHEQMLAQRLLATAQAGGSITASPLTASRRQLPILSAGQQGKQIPSPIIAPSPGGPVKSFNANSKERPSSESVGINSLTAPLLASSATMESRSYERIVHQWQHSAPSSVGLGANVRSSEEHLNQRHGQRPSRHPRDSDSHSSSTQPHMEQRSFNATPSSSRLHLARSHDGSQTTSSRSGTNNNHAHRSRSTSANPHRRQHTMTQDNEDYAGCGIGGGVSGEDIANRTACTGKQMDDIRKRVSLFLEELHRSTKIRTHFVIIPGVLLGTTMALLTRLCLWSGSPHCTSTFSFTQEPFSTSIYYWLAALFWVLEFIVLSTTVIFVFVLYYQQLMRVETFTYEKQSDTQLVGSILNPDNLFMWVKIWMLLIQEVRRRPTIQSTTYGTVVFSVLGIIGTASYTIFDNLGGVHDTAVFTISATSIGLLCLSTLTGLIWVTVRLQRVVRYEMHLIARVQTNVQQHLDLLKDDVDDGAARLLLTKINCLKALDAYIRTSESRPKLAGMTLETFRTSAILISLVFVNVAFFLLYITKCYTASEK